MVYSGISYGRGADIFKWFLGPQINKNASRVLLNIL